MKRLALLVLLTVNCGFAQVSFKSLSLPDAQRQAAAQRTGIMIDFYTDWCYWCKVMDGKTFSDAAVANYANSKFLCLKMDAEKGDGLVLAEKFAVSGYPTVMFIDADGHELYRVVGFEAPEKFLKSMNVASMGSIAQLEEHVKGNPDDAQSVYALAQKYAGAGQTERALDFYRRVVKLDEGNRQQLAEQAALAVAQWESKGGDVSALEAYVKDYPNAHSVEEVGYDLALRFLRAKNGAKAGRYMEMVAESGPANAERLNGYAWECAQQKLNLTRALEYARKAVSQASGPVQQATYLETQAEVLAALGKKAEAVKSVHEAMNMLVGEARNDKLQTQLQQRLTDFQK